MKRRSSRVSSRGIKKMLSTSSAESLKPSIIDRIDISSTRPFPVHGTPIQAGWSATRSAFGSKTKHHEMDGEGAPPHLGGSANCPCSTRHGWRRKVSNGTKNMRVDMARSTRPLAGSNAKSERTRTTGTAGIAAHVGLGDVSGRAGGVKKKTRLTSTY